MADDIDIEEHDVLDNPTIRNIFPDLSSIKEEISQYYEDVANLNKEPDASSTTKQLPENSIIPADTNKSLSPVNDQTSSKTQTLQPSTDIVENLQVVSNNPLQGTKIILGSKPNNLDKQNHDIRKYKEQTTSLASVVRIPIVFVQDLGEQIFQSNRYCQNCRTLFPTKSKFDVHKQLHSKKTQENKTLVKSSLKKLVNHKNICKMCSLGFSSENALNKHIKNVHKNTTKKGGMKKKVSCTTSKDTKKLTLCKNDNKIYNDVIIARNSQLKAKASLEPSTKKIRTKKIINQPLSKKHKRQRSLPNKNKCTICGSYFSSIYNLDRHYINIHKKKITPRRKLKKAKLAACTPDLSKNEKREPNLNNVCFHCNEQFPDQKCLIEHIYTVLEKKQSSKQNSKTNPTKLAKTKANETERVNIRIKDKLIFEDQDSESGVSPSLDSERSVSPSLDSERSVSPSLDSERSVSPSSDSENSVSPSSDSEYSEIDEYESKNQLTQDIKPITDKEQPDNFADDQSRISNRVSLKPLRNKRKHYISDDDLDSMDFSDTKEVNDNNHKSNKVSKKSKIDRECVNIELSIPKNNCIDTVNKNSHKVNKKEKSENDSIDSSISKNNSSTSKNNRLSIGENQEGFQESNKINEKVKLGSETIHSKKATSIKRKCKTGPQKSKQDRIVKAKKTKINIKIQLKNSIKTRKRDRLVYECIYCSTILATSRSYHAHLSLNHKVEKVSTVNQVIFDRRCKYCRLRVIKRYHNRHIRESHYDLLMKPYNEDADDKQEQHVTPAFKKPILKRNRSFVLKSIVYKCTQCHIHFLSSCVARDHEKHMELLLNWKCFTCKKIFKKHDKYLHLKQHQFSKTVHVYQFDQTELTRLLYNCTKCGIHFTEKRYLEHYSKCDNETSDSLYCKDCDILIDTCDYSSHEEYHKNGTRNEDFIIITGEIISKSNEDSKSQEILKNQDKSVSQKESSSEEEKEGSEYFRKISHNNTTNYLTFCQKCKCYLSDIAVSHRTHIAGRCSKIPKYTCPTCGLVFTNKTINSHRDHHRKVKGLKLQDFEFFDLNGLQIRPPLPEYPSCDNCKVIFVGRVAIINHICTETEFKTCDICNIKLSENAYKLHMNFHNYYMPNEIANKSLRIVPSNEHIDSDKTKTLTPSLCTSMVKLEIANSVVKTLPQEHEAGMNITAISVQKEKVNNLQTEGLQEITPTIQDPNSDTQKETESEHVISNNKHTNAIIYTCVWCKISIDTYDKVIEHCQDHFGLNPSIPSSVNVCSICLLNFEIDTYKIHKQHDCCDTFQVLIFDPTYFTSDNNIWTRHVFASVTPAIQKQIIESSKYKNECRFKIKVIQQGPSNLTVYKCDKCSNYIDIDDIILHLKSVCHRNIEKYPCLVCGLQFISKVSCMKHGKKHEQHEDVRIKSYNIILINCEPHNSYNTSMLKAMERYILYQCRTCDEIVNKLQRNDHTCNIDDLRKCPNCGLLLNKDEIERHISKHSDLTLYNSSNIKVIVFGNDEISISNKVLSSSFNGVVSDYMLYKCCKCDEYENDKMLMLRHVCKFDDSKWKCPKCGIFISASSLIKHIKRHDVDPDFTADNFVVVNFNSTKAVINNSDIKKAGHNDDSNANDLNLIESQSVTELGKDDPKQLSHNIGNGENSITDGENNDFVTLFKCPCGLHYLNENTAKNHSKLCNPRNKMIRQNCSKCTLMFTPKELFSHILAHHGDKNKTFKYNVIELDK